MGEAIQETRSETAQGIQWSRQCGSKSNLQVTRGTECTGRVATSRQTAPEI